MPGPVFRAWPRTRGSGNVAFGISGERWGSPRALTAHGGAASDLGVLEASRYSSTPGRGSRARHGRQKHVVSRLMATESFPSKPLPRLS